MKRDLMLPLLVQVKASYKLSEEFKKGPPKKKAAPKVKSWALETFS